MRRWSDERLDKKQSEMEAFNGKREVNEGETVSSISQSKVSVKAKEG